MPRNINLLLDQLVVDQEYRHSHGNTEPSILNGLFGNVKFVPWRGFRKIVNDAVTVVETFSESDLTEVNTSLHQARKFITRAKRHHMKSLAIERKRRDQYCNQNRDNSSNSFRLAQREENGSTDVVPLESSREAKRVKPNPNNEREVDLSSSRKIPKRNKSKQHPWYERKSVTNSTSISTLHHHVMDALRDFLDIMYPSHFLRVEEISLSCGNLMEGASESMLTKFMKELVLGTQTTNDGEASTASGAGTSISLQSRLGADNVQGQTLNTSGQNATAPDEAQTSPHHSASVENESSAEPVVGTNGSGEIEARLAIPMDEDPSSEIADNQAPGRSNRLQEKSRSSRSFHLQDDIGEDRSVWVPLRPVIPLNQTPDNSLFLNTVEKSSKIPVCCFEFKGPTLDLSGLISPRDAATRSSASNEVEMDTGGSSNEVEHSTASMPSVPLSCSQTVPRQSMNAEAEDASSMEVEFDGANVDNEDDMYVPGATATDVAEHYDELFSNYLSQNETGQKSSSRLVVLPIAQVICQAILSKTGCVFLTNHQMSLALRVVEDPEAERFRAKVFVTGAIPSNKEPGQVAALLGFTRFCLQMEANSDDEDLLDPMRRLTMGFSYLSYNSDIDEDTLDPDWCPGDFENDSQGSSSSVGRNQSEHVRRTQLSRQFDAIFTEKVDCDIDSNEDDTRTDISSGSDSSASIKVVGENLNVDNMDLPVMSGRYGSRYSRSRTDEKLMNMFASSKGTVAVGASGVVIKAVWDGVEAAAKMWNGHKREGFLNLRREIRIYKRIASKCHSILGSAVPRFLFGWDRPDMRSVYRKELILITEFVGSAIGKDESNCMLLLSEDSIALANKSEQRSICEAALRSLSVLHQNGFLHGDVALRNMRVARQEAEHGWKVWWLDLGKALEVRSTGSTSYFNMEIRQCLALFDQLA